MLSCELEKRLGSEQRCGWIVSKDFQDGPDQVGMNDRRGVTQHVSIPDSPLGEPPGIFHVPQLPHRQCQVGRSQDSGIGAELATRIHRLFGHNVGQRTFSVATSKRKLAWDTEKLAAALRHARAVTACELLAGYQAAALSGLPGRAPTDRSRALLDWLSGIISPIDGDRPFGEDLERIIGASGPPA